MDEVINGSRSTIERKCEEPDLDMLLDRYHFLQQMRSAGINNYEMFIEIALLKLRVLSMIEKQKTFKVGR
ncbi:MAG: hypothetical protein ACUZ8O_09925 [Candidatus Anammoxibacter sp.]